MGANARSTVGTATDAYTMLRIVFSRLGVPHVGTRWPTSASTARGHVPELRGARPGLHDRRRRAGRPGQVAERGRDHGARTSASTRWYWRGLRRVRLLRPGHEAAGLHRAAVGTTSCTSPADKIKVNGINTHLRGPGGEGPADVPGQGPGVRAAAHPGVRRPGGHLHAPARPAAAPGSTRRRWPRGSTAATSPSARRCRSATSPSSSREARRPVGGAAARQPAATLLDSLVEIGLGYLRLDRESGTLSGGEAQRVKMVRHLGSSLTDVTYVFDEPTVGLHPHDIQRMNDLLLRLRDKGNTVLVVEHKPETIEIADHVVDLGPGAGSAGGPGLLRGRRRRAARLRHADRPAPRPPGRPARRGPHAHGPAVDQRAPPCTTCRTSASTSRSACSPWSPGWPGRGRAR